MKTLGLQSSVSCLVLFLIISCTRGDFFPSDDVNPKILSGPPSRPYYPRPDRPSGGSHHGSDLSISGSDTQSNSNYQNHPSISSVDMQLLSAMEKLVSRIDKLDNRVKTLENVVYYLSNNKKKPEQGNCPKNFTQIDGIKGKCYHISSFSNPNVLYDWKTASAECSKLNSRLVEMITFDDFHRISQYLTKFSNPRAPSTDFYTGGLNPGLIWIWSESGQQVDLERRFWNENDNSSKAPGCLKLSYSVRLNAFFFRGGPCSQPHNYICEILDNKVARALQAFEQEFVQYDGITSEHHNPSENETV